MRKLIFIFFISSILTSSLSSCSSGAEDEDRGYIVKVGDAAPDFTMQLIAGEPVSLKDLRGKVVVLQFTASWCSVCRKEMPHLEKEIWLPNKEKDFILIGVDYDEPIEKVRKFANDMEISYPMALDSKAEIFSLFAHKKSGVTRNVVINREGKIIFLTRLYDTEEFEAMKKKIEEILN
jgi:peroxiredoxin